MTDLDEPSEDSEFDAMLKAVAAAPSIERAEASKVPLMTGVEVGGTFRVESMLGKGAMGVVYLATDLALDRPVALKLHNAVANDHGSRMWREAKAMARLSHPNVLTVYEVGTYQERVFIAMELVDGGTLREWLKTTRPWQEVVEVFIQAARGLAAAHEVGLVHRDFKPTNVLVGRDGRVRVADFGLARTAEGIAAAASDVALRREPSPSPSPEDHVTATGALVGTPFYMAPELRDGAPATARADQYAFWLSLHEALLGTPSGIHMEREPRAPAATGTVPKPIRAAISRGLSEDPEARFEDMDAVIVALTEGASRRGKFALLSAGALLIVGGGIGVDGWLDARGRNACRQRAEAIDEVIGEEARKRIDAAFRATGVPYAENTRARMEPILDAYAQSWSSSYFESCVAAEVDHSMTDARWAATRACLEDRRAAAGAWVDATAGGSPDESVVRDAVTASARLPALKVCTEEGWLERHPAGADDGEAEARAALRKAAALYAAGRGQDALRAVEPLLEYDDAGLRAEALVLAGEIDLALGEPKRAAERLSEGFERGLAMGSDDLALEAATELVYAVGSELHRFDEAQWWASVARSLLQRLGEADSAHAAAFHSNLGIVYEAQDRPEDAHAEHREAFAGYEKHLGEGHPELAFSRNNIGTSLLGRGDLEGAARELERATRELESVLGPDHPNVALGFNNLGLVYKRQQRLDDAERAQRRAIAVFEAGLGSEHPLLATMRANLGSTLIDLGRFADARTELRAALIVAESAQGPTGRRVGLVRHQLGNADLAQGRFDDALREHQAALKISIEADGPENPRAATSHFNVGRAHHGAGRIEEARRSYEQALGINVTTRGEDHPQTQKVRDALRELDAGEAP